MSIRSDALMHPDVPDAGASKRKQLSPQDKFDTVMAEFSNGTLRDSAGGVVVDRSQALAIAYSEMEKSSKEKSMSKLQKALQVRTLRKAKYLRRTGTSGNYKYIYKEGEKKHTTAKKLSHPTVEDSREVARMKAKAIAEAAARMSLEQFIAREFDLKGESSDTVAYFKKEYATPAARRKYMFETIMENYTDSWKIGKSL